MYFKEGKKIYLNREVSEVVGVTPRQVLSWTEKGLIVPFIESTGAGTKRGYNYINLLEFGLCKVLLGMGIGIRAVKKMLDHLKSKELLNTWVTNFSQLYSDQYLQIREDFNQAYNECGENPGSYFAKKNLSTIYDEVSVIEEPKGVLVYFIDDRGNHMMIIPWEAGPFIRLVITKQYLAGCEGGFLVDIGEIKERIDQKA